METIEKFLEGVVGIVEADYFSHQMLWEYNNREKMYSWIENLVGFMEIIPISTKPKKSMALSLRTAIINNQKILFVNPTSKYVDYDLINKWLLENVPESALKCNNLNMVNAMNFHNVFR
jgi:hypothetical protein